MARVKAVESRVKSEMSLMTAPLTDEVSSQESAEEVSDAGPFAALKELEQDCLRAYEEGVTIPEAEKLAAKFLHAQMQLGSINGLIHRHSLGASMKKNGHKTLRSKVYLEEASKGEKKPTEAALEALISTNTGVCQAQDVAERGREDAEALKRMFDVFKDAHIYFRGIAKGKFE